MHLGLNFDLARKVDPRAEKNFHSSTKKLKGDTFVLFHSYSLSPPNFIVDHEILGLLPDPLFQTRVEILDPVVVRLQGGG